MTQCIRVKKLREQAKLPSYGSAQAAGADLYACTGSVTKIPPHQTVMVPTGLAMAIPEGMVGLVFARSGLASKRGLAPANKVGVIDSDYRGELTVALHNHGSIAQIIEDGDRIAQLVIVPYVSGRFTDCDTLDETLRGTGGFGSTGV